MNTPETSPILTDGHGRRHEYLRISLTERCNLRCFYCMPLEGIALRPRSEFMRQEEVLEIARTFVELGVKKIRLTGGEPLVRKDAGEIIQGLSRLPVELAITTNGVLLDRFFDLFEDCGLQALNVSLDSLNPKQQAFISRRDYFDRIMRNIDLALQRGFKLKVNAVVMRGVNDRELVDFVKWTQDRELHLRFIEFMPFDGNAWNWGKKVPYAEMMDKIQGHFSKDQIIRLPGKAEDTAESYRIRGYRGTFGMISPITRPFCSSCNRIRLTADGKIRNCLFSRSETDLLSALREGKELMPLIASTIASKAAQWGGRKNFERSSGEPGGRPMIAIGG